jgi:hypothetical protein
MLRYFPLLPTLRSPEEPFAEFPPLLEEYDCARTKLGLLLLLLFCCCEVVLEGEEDVCVCLFVCSILAHDGALFTGGGLLLLLDGVGILEGGAE